MNFHEGRDGLLLLCVPGDLCHYALDGAHCRVQFGVRIYELPIQVIATERSPVVPNDDPVRIGHRYYFEDDPLRQLYSVRVCRTRDVG